MATLLGVFRDREDAEEVLTELEESGYSRDSISIVTKDKEEFHTGEGSPVASSAVTGAATGGILGGVAGLLIGIGAITIPGIGGLLIGGPLAAALGLSGTAATAASGAATGAVAGGLVGALSKIGIPESEAKSYEERVIAGDILLSVEASGPEDEEEIRDILESNGADRVRLIGR